MADLDLQMIEDHLVGIVEHGDTGCLERAPEDMAALIAEVKQLRADPLAARLLRMLSAAESKLTEFEAERERNTVLLSNAYRAVQRHQDTPRDFACAQCRPQSEMLIAGFVCTWHKALAFLRAEGGCVYDSCVLPGPNNGPSCRERQGFRFTSDDWCGCRCHRAAAQPGKEPSDA